MLTRDVDDRVVARTLEGVPGLTPDLTTSNVYNAAGQVLAATTHAGALVFTNSVALYDLAGRVTSRSDSLGNTTTYAHVPP